MSLDVHFESFGPWIDAARSSDFWCVAGSKNQNQRVWVWLLIVDSQFWSQLGSVCVGLLSFCCLTLAFHISTCSFISFFHFFRSGFWEQFDAQNQMILSGNWRQIIYKGQFSTANGQIATWFWLVGVLCPAGPEASTANGAALHAAPPVPPPSPSANSMRQTSSISALPHF